MSIIWLLTQAILSYSVGNGYNDLEYSPYIFDGVVGSQLLNIQEISSKLYGLDEYLEEKCWNATVIQDNINNTIPILAANFDIDDCNYIDIISKFQGLGARAIIILSNIEENSESPTSSPTPSIATKSKNYELWLPYYCMIEFNPSITNYS